MIRAHQPGSEPIDIPETIPNPVVVPKPTRSQFGSRRRFPSATTIYPIQKALRQHLLRLRIAWEECQVSRDRNAIYSY